MSPEQAESEPLDARADIFSFGCVLYEMLTGRRAFQGDSAMSTLSAASHRLRQAWRSGSRRRRGPFFLRAALIGIAK